MKLKIDREKFVIELHKKYQDGHTDEEIKSWLLTNTDHTHLTSAQMMCLRMSCEDGNKNNMVKKSEDIATWFKTQPHLPQPGIGQINKFLWAAKYNVEHCKKGLVRYYTLRGTDDELFGNRDPCGAETSEVAEATYFTALPGFTDELYRITFSALRTNDPDKFKPREWIRNILYLSDLRARDDFCLGDIVVYDLKGFSMQHLIKIPISLAKKLVVATEGGLPTKIKQIHLINSPAFVDKVISLFRPFLKEKLASRIYAYTKNYEKLYEFIPKKMLPNEYGGEAGTLDDVTEFWRKELEENRGWFIQQEKDTKRIFLEAKRAGKLFVDSAEMFGMEGSFKKLSID